MFDIRQYKMFDY